MSEIVINYAQLGLNASNPAIQRPSWSLESRCHNPECQLPGAVGFVNGYRQRSQKTLCDGGEKHGKVLLQAICDTQTTYQTTQFFAFTAPHCGCLPAHRLIDFDHFVTNASLTAHQWAHLTGRSNRYQDSQALHHQYRIKSYHELQTSRFSSASIPENNPSIVVLWRSSMLDAGKDFLLLDRIMFSLQLRLLLRWSECPHCHLTLANSTSVARVPTRTEQYSVENSCLFPMCWSNARRLCSILPAS